VLRRQWLAAGAFVALLVFMNTYDSSYPRVDVPLWVIVGSTAAFVLWRYGILTLMAVKAFSQLLSDLFHEPSTSRSGMPELACSLCC